MTPSPKGRKKPTALDCAIEYYEDIVKNYGAGKEDKNLLRALKAARRDRERLDWLLDSRDCSARVDPENGDTGEFFNNRREVDAAIRQSREK